MWWQKPVFLNTQRFFESKTADLCTCFLLVLGTIVWSALAGKDLNFDQLHYHYYLGFNLLNGRIGHDFMAANAQSYLNPLVYVPFYWMVNQGWHSLIVASVLSAFHGLALVLTYLIVKNVLGNQHGSSVIAALGAALAFLSPMFLLEAGTSFADITTAVLLLAAVLCLLRSHAGEHSLRRLVLAGALVGAAGGFKFSNLVFSPAFLVLVLAMHPSLRATLRGLSVFGFGAALGLIAAHGYWSWQLLTEFGDLSAPTLGSLMGSVAVPQGSDVFPRRFLPESIWEALSLPFRMMAVRSWIYIESVAPDLRFATVIVVAVIGAVIHFWRPSEMSNAERTDHRKQHALLLFFALTLLLWVLTSANGRYGIFVSILCGPVLALQIAALSRRKDVAIGLLIAVTTLQWLHVQHGQLRWVSEEWTPSWYEIVVPEELQKNASLYLSLGGNSSSYIIPFVHHESAFVNPIGQLSIDNEGPAYKRLQTLLQKYAGKIRVIAKTGEPTGEDQVAVASWQHHVDNGIARLGFAVDINDCLLVSAAGSHSPWDSQADDEASRRTYLRTCALVARPYLGAEERARIQTLVRDIVAWCPRLFRAPVGVVEQMPSGWSAVFSSTDSTLLVQSGRILLSPKQALSDLNLGTIEQWDRGERPDCAKMPRNLRKQYTF